MEEQEAPLEDVREEIHHHAEHARERWVMGVALSTALLAAVAAIASLLSGDHVNDAVLEQMKAADTWNYFQAEGIKSAELETRSELLPIHSKSLDALQEKIAEYKIRRTKLSNEAEELEASVDQHMNRHHRFAKSVTWSQIAIAISAIAVLTRQKWFWLVGLGFGVAGVFYLFWGIVWH